MKPVGEESSDGIAKASFAKSEEEALERARFIHEKFHCDALIEEYIEGRELYLSVMGNRKLTRVSSARNLLPRGPGRHAQVRHLQGQVGRHLPQEVGHSEWAGE